MTISDKELVEGLPVVGNALEFVRKLAWEAFLSRLTGLPNSAAYELTAEEYDRSVKARASVAFVDLTGFKAINDQHGHEAGDGALREAGRRVAEMARQVDGRPYHLSGDEYVVLFEGARLEEIRTKYLSDLSRFSFSFAKKTIDVRASMGIALPDEAAVLADLRGRAEKACKQAKGRGLNEALVWSEADQSIPVDLRFRCESCSATISVTVAAEKRHPTFVCSNCRREVASLQKLCPA